MPHRDPSTARIHGPRTSVLAVLAATALATALTACGSAADTPGSAPVAAASSLSATDVSAALGPAKKAAGSPVTIGFVTAEGSSSALNLPETREGAAAAANYADEHLGGLAGHPIKLLTCKDKSDGASATACANQFATSHVAAVVVGQVANPDLYIPILRAAGIPWIAEVGAGQQEVTSDIAFDLTGGTVGAYAATAQIAKEKGYKKVLYFGIDVPAFTGAFGAYAKPAYAKAGVEVDLVTVPAGTPDATPQVVSGMAKSPDAVVIVADSTLCKALLPAVHDANSAAVPVFMPSLCASQDVISTVGQAAVDGATVNGNAVALGTSPEAELYKAVMQSYAPSVAADGKAGSGYVAMLGLVRAVNAAQPTGTIDAAAVLNALRTAKDVPLPGFPNSATFTCDGSAVPGIKALCTAAVLFSDVKGTTMTGFRAEDGSVLLKK
jgi:branched-chain amino acid transport system substrate-binding protein